MEKSNLKDKNRRGFFSFLLTGKDNTTSPNKSNSEKVKMLTADGKLVEIDKAILDEVAKNQKSTNKEIFDWMKNPSKENK
jgi:hypothetical protein